MNDKAIAFGICALILFAVFVSGCAEEKEDKKEEEEEIEYGNVECEVTNHGSEGHYVFVQCTYYDHDAWELYVDINSETVFILSKETKSLIIYNIPVGEKYRPTVKLYTDITDWSGELPDETYNGRNYWWYIYGDDDTVDIVVVEGKTITIQLSILSSGDEVGPTAQLKLTSRDELNSTLGQNLSMVSHKSGDNVKWDDMKIMLSNDGATYYVITFGVEQSTLKVLMTKGANIGDFTLFEVGEIIFFNEGTGNWDALNDFYIMIVHTPSSATIYETNIDLV